MSRLDATFTRATHATFWLLQQTMMIMHYCREFQFTILSSTWWISIHVMAGCPSPDRSCYHILAGHHPKTHQFKKIEEIQKFLAALFGSNFWQIIWLQCFIEHTKEVHCFDLELASLIWAKRSEFSAVSNWCGKFKMLRRVLKKSIFSQLFSFNC